MSNQTLRELAKGYAKGIIAKDDYRKSRAELIIGITTNKIAVKTIDYPPPLSPSAAEQAITENAVRNKTEVTPPPASKSSVNSKSTTTAPKPTPTSSKKSPVMFISVSAGIVILLIVGVILFYPKPPVSSITQETNQSAVVIQNNAEDSKSNMAGEMLIADFLSEKNWNEDSLDAFLNSWNTLTQDERNSAGNTKRMQRMQDSIYKQFLEGKALASIDSEKAVMKQEKLIAFATAIGISDSRLILE